MLQELTAQTNAAPWAIASMLFFIGVWVWVAIGVARARSEDMEACARLALDGDDATAVSAGPTTGPKA